MEELKRSTGMSCVFCCAPAGTAHDPKCRELTNPTKEVSLPQGAALGPFYDNKGVPHEAMPVGEDTGMPLYRPAPIQSAELAVTDAQVAGAVRAFVNAVKGGADMMGAIRRAVEEAHALAAPALAQQASSDHKAAFEAWAAKDGTYDLRPAKVKVLSVGGVPYDGYVRPYLQDRTVYTYQGYLAAMTGRSMHDAPAAQEQASSDAPALPTPSTQPVTESVKPLDLRKTLYALRAERDASDPNIRKYYNAVCDRLDLLISCK